MPEPLLMFDARPNEVLDTPPGQPDLRDGALAPQARTSSRIALSGLVGLDASEYGLLDEGTLLLGGLELAG